MGGTLEKISLFIFQRTFSGKNLVPAQKNFSFHFTTDIFSEKNRGLLENKNAPGLGKSGSIVICGYEISENSKHSRCPYTAAK